MFSKVSKSPRYRLSIPATSLLSTRWHDSSAVHVFARLARRGHVTKSPVRCLTGRSPNLEVSNANPPRNRKPHPLLWMFDWVVRNLRGAFGCDGRRARSAMWQPSPQDACDRGPGRGIVLAPVTVECGNIAAVI